ncbi:MAG: hypothetical protein LBF25_02490 [Puniceicoccales bacterium]|jgi:hypothetical protein|nr:hypothetical protein [Puniceicoccales bacterium]
MHIKGSDGSKQTGDASRVPPTNPIGRPINIAQHDSPAAATQDERTSPTPIESRTAAQRIVGAFKGLWSTCRWTFQGAWWTKRVLNVLVPPTVKNCTVDDVELMSEENKRMLLRDASTKDLQGLIARDKEVFLQLFSVLRPEDVALRAKCFECFKDVPEFQGLRGEFLPKINEYLSNLKMEGLKALPPDDRRALLEYASPEALEQLIGRNRQIFLQLFIALRAGDMETMRKCFPFFSETEALPLLWASIREIISLNPLGENKFLNSRRVWQAMAVPMASFCFDESGKVDLKRVAVLRSALVDQGSFFYQEPCSNVPGIELICIQAARVLGNGDLFSVLDDASDLEPSAYGRQVLSVMSLEGQPPLKLNVAVLASLLSPHRQAGLPTCTINSIMNADIHNDPAIPARMMIQMLATGLTNTPSGYVLCSPPIKYGYVAVDLSNGLESEAKIIFDPNRVDKWAIYGITRDEENGNILLPIFDANDLLFAAYFQASLFGNRGLESHHGGNFGTMFMRYGIDKAYLSSTDISNSSRSMEFAIERMQSEARRRRATGENLNYMRISTISPAVGHAENIDVDALLKLDLSKLEKGKPYIIGDRNCGATGVPNHLAVVKTSAPGVNPSMYWFETVYPDGKRFRRENIITIEFYATKVKSQGFRPWRVNESGTIVYEPGQAAQSGKRGGL